MATRKKAKPTVEVVERPKCQHPVEEEVRSAHGENLYGWRCLACAKQWQRSVCTDCRCVQKHVANISRKTWTCRPCLKKRLMRSAGKAA